MISTTYSGATVLLLNDAPDWSNPVKATLGQPVDVVSGLTNHESRRSFYGSVAVGLRYSVLLQGAAARLLYGGLRAATTPQVIVPFWPAQTTYGQRGSSPITGGLMVAWKADWSQYAIYTSGGEPGWAVSGDQWAPALMGYLAPSNNLTWLSDNLLQWDSDFQESSPPNLRLAFPSISYASGPQPAGYTSAPLILPFRPNWDRLTDTLSVRISRENVGFRRQQNQTFYPQSVVRMNDAGYLLTSQSAIGQFIRFFSDQSVGASFWAPAWTSQLQLAAAVASGDTTLTVVDTGAVAVGDYIALVSASAIVGRKITGISGTTITLNSAVGTAFALLDTVVCPLLLARISEGAFSVEWTAPNVATGRIKVTELPAEYAVPSGETLGTTLGSLPSRAILIELTQYAAGTGYTTYWTSYEADLSYGGNTYTSADFAQGELRESLNLERTSMELTSQLFSGNPLTAQATLAADGPMGVVVRWATLVSGSVSGTPAVVFTGEVTKVSIRGSKITATCTPGGNRYDGQYPRLLRGPGCSATLFYDGCGLNAVDWKWTGTVASPVSSAYPFELKVASLTQPGSVAASGASWFAGGWVEWGAGSARQRRAILDSTAPSGGSTTLTLARYFGLLPTVGDAVALYPGCDQQMATCKGKFNNFVNFRGHPFTPPGNPTLAVRSGAGSGGKK